MAERACAMTVTLPRPHAETVDATRASLAEQGFGMLTEIDLAATMRAKLGVDIAPLVILGACRPPLAYGAVLAEPSIATMLPCNVVVRDTGDTTTVIEAFDPETMVALSESPALRTVASDARNRLTADLTALKEQ
jgi:uncharacterized protein (DUF302 family)